MSAKFTFFSKIYILEKILSVPSGQVLATRRGVAKLKFFSKIDILKKKSFTGPSGQVLATSEQVLATAKFTFFCKIDILK